MTDWRLARLLSLCFPGAGLVYARRWWDFGGVVYWLVCGTVFGILTQSAGLFMFWYALAYWTGLRLSWAIRGAVSYEEVAPVVVEPEPMHF